MEAVVGVGLDMLDNHLVSVQLALVRLEDDLGHGRHSLRQGVLLLLEVGREDRVVRP